MAPVGMWAKASISLLFELAREAGEAQAVGEADRPHIHRRSCCGLTDFGMMTEGSPPLARRSRHKLVFGRSEGIGTMMQSCASRQSSGAAGPFLIAAQRPCPKPVHRHLGSSMAAGTR